MRHQDYGMDLSDQCTSRPGPVGAESVYFTHTHGMDVGRIPVLMCSRRGVSEWGQKSNTVWPVNGCTSIALWRLDMFREAKLSCQEKRPPMGNENAVNEWDEWLGPIRFRESNPLT